MWGPQFCLLVSKPSIVMFVSQITNHREIGCIIYKPYNIVYEPTSSICLYILYHKTIIVKLEWLVHQLSHPVWRSKRRWLRCGSCRSPFTSWPWIHSSGLRPFGRLRNLLEKPHRNFSQHALWITIYQQFMDGQTKRAQSFSTFNLTSHWTAGNDLVDPGFKQGIRLTISPCVYFNISPQHDVLPRSQSHQRDGDKGT